MLKRVKRSQVLLAKLHLLVYSHLMIVHMVKNKPGIVSRFYNSIDVFAFKNDHIKVGNKVIKTADQPQRKSQFKIPEVYVINLSSNEAPKQADHIDQK